MEMGLKRGDIVLVDLTGAIGVEKQNDETNQARPCLIVQNDKGNAVSPLTIVAPITDIAQFKNLPVQVHVTTSELGSGSKDSVVECGHLRSIDRSARIQTQLGTIAPEAMKRVDLALRVSLGL
jgi:mRNA interferase MazF